MRRFNPLNLVNISTIKARRQLEKLFPNGLYILYIYMYMRGLLSQPMNANVIIDIYIYIYFGRSIIHGGAHDDVTVDRNNAGSAPGVRKYLTNFDSVRGRWYVARICVLDFSNQRIYRIPACKSLLPSFPAQIFRAKGVLNF